MPPFPRYGSLVLAGLLAAAVAGCSGASEEEPQSPPELTLTVSPVPLTAYRPDPRDCIVGTHDGEIRLAARPNVRGQLCRRLAARYLPAARALSWRKLNREREAPTLVCALSRKGVSAVVLTPANASNGRDPVRICERLSADGWRRTGLLAPSE